MRQLELRSAVLQGAAAVIGALGAFTAGGVGYMLMALLAYRDTLRAIALKVGVTPP